MSRCRVRCALSCCLPLLALPAAAETVIVGQSTGAELRSVGGDVILDADGRSWLVGADGERWPGPPIFPLEVSSSRLGGAPSGPPFEPAGTYAIHPGWRWAPLGSTIGGAGLQVLDLDGDSAPEIVTTGGGSGFGSGARWFVLGAGPSGIAQRFVSAAFPQAIEDLVAVLREDAPPEVFVLSGAAISVFEGEHFSLDRTLGVPVSSPIAMAVADLDLDRELEVIVTSALDLAVLDAASGAVEAIRYGFGGYDLAVGNTDDDLQLEIAIAAGEVPGYIVDGISLTVDWGRNEGFGWSVTLPDIDGDGQCEVAFVMPWYDGAYLYDPRTGEQIWNVPYFNLATIDAADVDGDGNSEVLVGEAQWGDVQVLTGVSGLQQGHVANPEHGVTRVTAADVDGDGEVELLWGAGATSSGPDHLFVGDPVAHVVEWASRDIRGPFAGLDAGDVDGDGDGDLMVLADSSDSGYGDGLFLLFDGSSGELWKVSGEFSPSSFLGVSAGRLAQVDGSGPLDICLATGASGYTGRVECVDSFTEQVLWGVNLVSGLMVTALEIRDVDRDGEPELVFGTTAVHTGAPGTYVYALELATGWLEWRSPDLLPWNWNGIASLVLVPSVDASAMRCVASRPSLGVVVLDGDTGLVDASWPRNSLRVHTAYWMESAAAAVAFVGQTDGIIAALDLESGAAIATIADLPQRIDRLVPAHLTPDSAADLLVASGGGVAVIDVASGTVLAAAEPFGAGGTLFARDLDADGRIEIVADVGSGVEVLEFESPALFVDDFEMGDFERWWIRP